MTFSTKAISFAIVAIIAMTLLLAVACGGQKAGGPLSTARIRLITIEDTSVQCAIITGEGGAGIDCDWAGDWKGN